MKRIAIRFLDEMPDDVFEKFESKFETALDAGKIEPVMIHFEEGVIVFDAMQELPEDAKERLSEKLDGAPVDIAVMSEDEVVLSMAELF